MRQPSRFYLHLRIYAKWPTGGHGSKNAILYGHLINGKPFAVPLGNICIARKQTLYLERVIYGNATFPNARYPVLIYLSKMHKHAKAMWGCVAL